MKTKFQVYIEKELYYFWNVVDDKVHKTSQLLKTPENMNNVGERPCQLFVLSILYFQSTQKVLRGLWEEIMNKTFVKVY